MHSQPITQMQVYNNPSPAVSQSVDTSSLNLRETNSRHNSAIDIQYYNLSYVVRKGDVSKTILYPMSGVVEHGKLTVIMGPSGAGKSSLMNILSGYRSQVAGGEICINGRVRNMRAFKSLSSYIMQHDQLHPNLTVLEAMMFAAKLKLPHHISEANKHSLAMDVIESLGLGNCLHVNACKLSGGQRKRLAIAQELISDPAVIFLDEPTSGLDSSSTYQCVKLLKYLAELGHTVICTIHQPSTKPFLLFDHLILLAKGRVLYSGPNVHLDSFFASHGFVCPLNYNRADYIIEVAIEDCGPTDLLVTALESQSREFNSQRRSVGSNKMSRSNFDVLSPRPSELGIGFKKSTMQHFPTSFVYQFYILLIRTTKCTLRDSSLTRLRLISHLGLAIVVGLLYLNVGSKNDSVLMNTAVQFISIMFVMYLSLMPTVLSFPLEREILVREHLNSWYRLFSYYMAKTFADTPLQIILPVMYGTIIYWMTAQSSEGYRFILYLTICVLIGLVSQSLGLLIGAGCSMETGVFLAPVMTTPMLLFSGYFIPLNSIPGYLRWFSYFSLIRYGFLGAIQTIYGFDRGELGCANPQRCMFPTGQDVLETMDALDLGYYSNFIVLCVLCVFFRIVAFFALKLHLNRTND